MQNYAIQYIGLTGRDYHFSYKEDKKIIISFPCESIFRFRIHDGTPRASIMVENRFIKETISNTYVQIDDSDDIFTLTCGELDVTLSKDGSGFSIKDHKEHTILKGDILSGAKPGFTSELSFTKSIEEHFYGFGFQRKTLDASGQILTFKKEYRWDEATVPYFLSSEGYGFFSSNTYDHTFNFTENNSYTVKVFGGDVDIFIINGPDYKKIINSYTALTGRPHMIPAWGLGLCYVARLFENQEGLLEIAKKFRSEGIPCDMLGLEPGWEKHYYQMRWVWNNDMFPSPKAMIDQLHSLGYTFELWESGDAPTSGYMNPEKRKQWFAERIDASLSIGVDFYKQDDPYPRCITSEEMVDDPTVEVFLEDDGKYSEAETRNIANTLYSATVFEEMRRITGKRAFVIFHSYGATMSSQMYPCAWAGDFNLGNGALNAGLSGHSMVTQDMRSEVPAGIHFGFMMPFALMDSWAYYLEPWLFADHIKEMIRFYSRFRVSLFPYLYTLMWLSHTTGLPILRPMLLEFQNDPVTPGLEEQFMLGDSLLVGINSQRGSSIYLPEGKWVDFWTRNTIESNGSYHKCNWPAHVGGPLFVKLGAIIPMMNSADSILLCNMDFLLLDIYPDNESFIELYEDNGITYDYENDKYSITTFNCIDSKETILINLGIARGEYPEQQLRKAFLLKVFLTEKPNKISAGTNKLTDVESLDSLIYSYNAGWFYSSDSNTLFIKYSRAWKFFEKLDDTNSFYNAQLTWIDSPDNKSLEIVIHKSTISENSNEMLIVFEDENEKIILPSDSEFNITVNPPKRVRLNHGDSWLPYNIYVGFEIVSKGKRVYSASPIVSLIISSDDERNIDKNHSTNSYKGTGHFEKIVVGSASEPPNITITLSAEGVRSKTIRYKPAND
ncbi:MAG: DUF5110 domain-containing protein [Clostridiales bacterium]|nr:DUF5110 domain-containing protein [Clostridiales bacterium]